MMSAKQSVNKESESEMERDGRERERAGERGCRERMERAKSRRGVEK